MRLSQKREEEREEERRRREKKREEERSSGARRLCLSCAAGRSAMGLKKAKETKVEEVDLEAMDVDEAAKAEAEEEDYHRRNRALRPRFQLDLTPDLKREKKAEQRVPSGGMKVAKAKLARNAVIDSDDDDDEEEVEKKKVERKIKSEDNKEASTSSASRKKSTAKMDYVEDEVDDHFLANEEDEAKGILDSMDREQYYPILLDFEDGEVVTAQAPQQDDDNPLAYRRDMNGKTVLENVEEEDNIASFVGQDGKDLVRQISNSSLGELLPLFVFSFVQVFFFVCVCVSGGVSP